MIANKIIEDFHLVKKENKYIVDTNILVYAYGDGDSSKNKERLTTIMVNALNCGCDVYIPSIVVSEFVNCVHRNYFNKHKYSRGWHDFKKDYRNTPKYVENNNFIYRTFKENILDRFKLISDGFESASISNLMAIDETQDFNDNLIIDIANKNGLFIISDDLDTKKIHIK